MGSYLAKARIINPNGVIKMKYMIPRTIGLTIRFSKSPIRIQARLSGVSQCGASRPTENTPTLNTKNGT